MKNKSILTFYQKYKFYLFPVAVAISSLILIIFAIYPQTISLLNNRQMVGELQNKSNILETKAAALESFDEAELTRKVGITLNAFPPERDFENILGIIQQLAAQSGFNINSFSLGDSSKKSANTNSYDAKLEINGSQILIPNLIQEIENSTRLMKVRNIDITSNQKTRVSTVVLTVEVFYAALPQTFGTPESPLPLVNQKDEEFLALLAGTANINTNPQASSSGSLTTGPLPPRGRENPFE